MATCSKSLFLFAGLVLVSSAFVAFGACPCQRPEDCQIRNTTSKEIFIFSLSNSPSVWMKYDWNKVTSVVMVGYNSPQLMCHAHRHGARVINIVNYPKDKLTDAASRKQWVSEQLDIVKKNYLDGINIDFEDPIAQWEVDISNGYSSLVSEAYQAFKAVSPHYQVTVDVAWSPDCIDGRCYNISALAASTDFLFVMSYDEQSQIFGDCIAGANSGYYKTKSGLDQYLALGVYPNKTVLGIPWYGYKYQCLTLTKDNKCYIPHIPFRGVNCSDAAGIQYDFKILDPLSLNSTTGKLWDNATLSPYYNYKDPSSGQLYQVWYDDPDSLTKKYDLATLLGLRGVGMWNSDCLDNGDTAAAAKQRQAMWGALPSYKAAQRGS